MDDTQLGHALRRAITIDGPFTGKAAYTYRRAIDRLTGIALGLLLVNGTGTGLLAMEV